MPTTRPRVLVTETDELTAALDSAARTWPDERSRSRLLARLATLGAEQLAADDAGSRASRRRSALRRHDARLEGLFPAGYRDGLRDEWPQ